MKYALCLLILMVNCSCRRTQPDVVSSLENIENIIYLHDWSKRVFDGEPSGLYMGGLFGAHRLDIEFDWNRFGIDPELGEITATGNESSYSMIFISPEPRIAIIISKSGNFGVYDNTIIWRNGNIGYYDRWD